MDNHPRIVCVEATVETPFFDNRTAQCAKCGVQVHVRSHVPVECVPWCLRCFLAEPIETRTSISITSETAREVQEYFERQRRQGDPPC